MGEKRRLPVVAASSVAEDGTRNWVHPADVDGRYTRARRIVFAILVGILIVVPWIRIDGRAAIHLDIEHRLFFLFGWSFNAQDAWLLFFLLTGAGFALLVSTTIVGRIWCGFTCPQTVFLEGAYRHVERWIEGDRGQRIRRDRAPMSWHKLWRKALKHALFIALSILISHACLSYFVSIPSLLRMVRGSPLDHLEAFAWMAAFSVILYGNFAFFREQLCLAICPYGRLQSVLTDRDTVVVGYDVERGEPRGKATDPDAGDCVACGRCVAVCPTGIDIRAGLQLDCIGCAACIDACDEIMDKLERPRGLVRYDSQRAFDGHGRHFFRPRLLLYAVLGVIGLAIAVLSFGSRSPFEANLLRLGGAPFVQTENGIQNGYEFHLINKQDEPVSFTITVENADGVRTVISDPNPTLAALAERRIPVFVVASRSAAPAAVELTVTPRGGDGRTLAAPFITPAR